MKKVVHFYRSFEEAEEANIAYSLSLLPEERFQIAREILETVHGDLSLLPDVREYERGKSRNHSSSEI